MMYDVVAVDPLTPGLQCEREGCTNPARAAVELWMPMQNPQVPDLPHTVYACPGDVEWLGAGMLTQLRDSTADGISFA